MRLVGEKGLVGLIGFMGSVGTGREPGFHHFDIVAYCLTMSSHILMTHDMTYR